MVPAASLRSVSTWDGLASGVFDTDSVGGGVTDTAWPAFAGAGADDAPVVTAAAFCTADSTVAPISVRRSTSPAGVSSGGFGASPTDFTTVGPDVELPSGGVPSAGVPSAGV